MGITKISLENIKGFWWVPVLIVIFLFSFYVRDLGNVPDKILSYDPVFQYRFTRYFAEHGTLPLWDELTYYSGRAVDPSVNPPLIYYATAFLYWIQPFNWSLFTTAAFAGAFYGALIILAAFLLGRELSNNYGGLLAAILVGTAPQILIRTFGASFDTDQLALFFILFTLYTGLKVLKTPTVANFSLSLGSLFVFMIAWNTYMYTFAILGAFVAFNFLVSAFLDRSKDANERMKHSKGVLKTHLIVIAAIFIGLTVTSFIVRGNAIEALLNLFAFAQSAEAWIVNISIAELQPFSIFNINGWITATGRFAIGDALVDTLMFLSLLVFLAYGLYRSYKKEKITFSFIATILLVGIYTSFKGIRFTEFTSAMFLVLIGAGFGMAADTFEKRRFLFNVLLGGGLIIGLFASSLGLQMARQLGPDVNGNWDNAWEFLRTQTPENSLVGTWWDPGHMITGYAERRVIADGAHCGNQCLYTINDRITDLGKIASTADEDESIALLRKYQGTSPKIYWIASDDLISKYRWLLYFGTGCDTCPLYIPVGRGNVRYLQTGQAAIAEYPTQDETILVFLFTNPPVAAVSNGKEATFFKDFYVYEGNKLRHVEIEDAKNSTDILISLQDQLDLKFNSGSYVDSVLWTNEGLSLAVAIPPNLKDTMFTKQFFYEGQGLANYKQVFRNNQVKIYEVI